VSQLLVLGINHQNAPVAVRERVAVAMDAVPEALRSLRALPQVEEVALLSTCNRTEIYAAASYADDGALSDWLASLPGDPSGLHAYLYRHRNADAARHLFRVASGLDSMVLGEPQILGQVKQAWAVARAAGTLGSRLDRLFQHAFVTAKRARTETRIGSSPVSVASAAVRLLQESFARPSQSTVLLIGAGETIELAARHLVQAKVARLLVANRTLAHAQALASRHGGYALDLSGLDLHLAEADVIISATASRDPVITRTQVETALARRKHRPMLLIDLAVPRDIDQESASLHDAYLYTIDDLQHLVEHNRRSRRAAAEEAESIIELQLARYAGQSAASAHSGAIQRLRAHGETARIEALTLARTQLNAGVQPEAVLELLARTLTNRLLHAPTVALREAAIEGDTQMTRTLQRIFPIEEERVKINESSSSEADLP